MDGIIIEFDSFILSCLYIYRQSYLYRRIVLK